VNTLFDLWKEIVVWLIGSCAIAKIVRPKIERSRWLREMTWPETPTSETTFIVSLIVGSALAAIPWTILEMSR
jgi:hypothetical protein